ncbi:MAG: hypothetical protein EPO36_00300 [Chloroflexota bacterium]|nr:MAG: hypothetical protein EPO36_00300 [Chloroflexota bacterium]
MDPKIHSPRKSSSPTGRRKPSSRSIAKARPPSAATRPTSPMIAPNSALASSMWAVTTRRAAPMTAATCSRSPGAWASGAGSGVGSRAGPPSPESAAEGAVDSLAGAVGSGSLATNPPGRRAARLVRAAVRDCSSGLRPAHLASGPRNVGRRSHGLVGSATLSGMRQIHTAELLSIGSELTVGETRDTNAGELARALTDQGVEVTRMTALPDDLATVSDAFRAALTRSDLAISTGGLGPTPDDLTRESIAAALGETPAVDPELEAWLRRLFERRSTSFPEANLKQAWRIPSATSIPNDNGTAPGWWVDAPDGRVVVALPGPPREMRPMWSGWVIPRLRERGLGQDTVAITLRTSGLGESLIAQRLGRLLDRGANPTVATYARHDAVDIRISARPGGGVGGVGRAGNGGASDGDRGADPAALVAAAEAAVLEQVGDHVWGRGDVTWAAAIGERLAERGWRLAVVELGTRGSVLALLGEGLGDRLVLAEALGSDHRPPGGGRIQLPTLAQRVRAAGGAEVGLAVRASVRGSDMAVSVAIADPRGTHAERRLAFLAGPMGRTRAALLAAAVLHARLRA